MTLKIYKARSFGTARIGAMFMTVMFVLLVATGLTLAETVKQRTFASPEDAVEAVIEALAAEDQQALEAIFGSGSDDLFISGDPVADQAGREKFLKLYYENNRLEQTTDKAILSIGNKDWPFSIPMLQKDGVWRFDTNEGREEILARRIGRNELSTIQVCLAYVDAQREYALKDRDADGVLQYARQFRSDRGMKNGLYWEVKEGEGPSPLGPLFAAAQEEGYSGKKGDDRPIPYYGYYYRILTGQGKDAPGGAYDYVVMEKMIGGFALVAYPAKYASSGVMTFIVNHRGVVYQKDLGQNSANAAQTMTQFNPDSMWNKLE